MSQPQCLVPVSLGELFDKYSILQIKSEQVTDNEKLELVEKELEYLKPLVKKYPLDPSYKKSIRVVNEKLWDIEDKIREKERKNEFDEEFIELARQVYKTNDERCVIKNKINVILNSDITEIKSYVNLEKNKEPNDIIYIDEDNTKDINETKRTETKKTEIKKTEIKKTEIKKTETKEDLLKLAVKYKNDNKHFLAIEAYNKLLVLQPSKIEYLESLGEVYENANLHNEAIECFEKIIKIQPYNGVIVNRIGMIYFIMSNFEKALEYFKQILNIKNDIPDVYNNMSNCYVSLKQYKMAETVLKISLNLRKDKNIYDRLGNLYYIMKRYDESMYFYKQIEEKDRTPKDIYNLSYVYLATKKLKKGFEMYENHLATNDINPQTKLRDRLDIPHINNWNGIDACESLLVLYEQGIGDNIMYFRFIIQLAEKYPEMKITYYCRGIFEYFFKSYKNITVKTDNIPNVISNEEYDFKLYIMSLPHILKINKIIPNKENYISQNPLNNLHWKNKLKPLKKPRVGFVYNGLLISYIEKYIPLKEFAKLTKLDIDLICLCKMDEIKNSIDKNDKNINKIHFYDIDKEKLFCDTISILQNIDLLITIDTAIVHLAGVLNIKTWLLLGYGTDWRWFDTPGKTDWYDSVELLRITENVELQNIIPVVEQKLKQFIQEQKEKEEKEQDDNIIVLD